MKGCYFAIIAGYICVIIYKLKFYKILHHRKYYYVGEVDIIASRNREMVFVEVKVRNSKIDDGFVFFNHQGRTTMASEMFLSIDSKYRNYSIRFDLVI